MQSNNQTIILKTSWLLSAFIITIYLGGIGLTSGLLWQLPWQGWKGIALLLILVGSYSFYHNWNYFVTKQAKRAIIKLRIEDEQWVLQTREGKIRRATLLPNSVIQPPILFLYFKDIDSKKKQLVMVTADSVGAWRHLCQIVRNHIDREN